MLEMECSFQNLPLKTRLFCNDLAAPSSGTTVPLDARAMARRQLVFTRRQVFGAGEGNRTLVCSLGSQAKLLNQLSHVPSREEDRMKISKSEGPPQKPIFFLSS